MKHSLSNLVRAVVLLLMFVPAPLAIIGSTAAVAAEPAVVIAEEVEEAEEDPWTARFLAPATAALGALVVVSSAAYYVVRIRGRYRVI